MDFFRALTGQRPSVASDGADELEDVVAEVDDPPEWQHFNAQHKDHQTYTKAVPPAMYGRRESLLTRQLHSENEHTDEETPHPPRTLSTQSTWSTYSTTSTAELTSDDGRSVPSPAVSPPLPPTTMRGPLPVPDKVLGGNVQIVGQEGAITVQTKPDNTTEKTIEANLGRKRCISFACGGKTKEKAKPVSPPAVKEPVSTQTVAPASPPKRKCALKFVCPGKEDAASKPVAATTVKRAVSPPPPPRRTTSQSKAESVKVHRGSDSTVTHASPKSVRRTPIMTPSSTAAKPATVTRKLSNDSDDSGTEATRFHVFGASEDEPEEWVKESTCHRSRLTISDTLKKENVIRQACEEVEEEVIEEEEGEDEDEVAEAEVDVLEEEEEDDDDGDFDDDAEQDDEDEGSECSDEGFHSDDEQGFASSDSEGEDSDGYEWWRPGGGPSTAATSVEHMDRMTIKTDDDNMPASSVGSVSSGQASPRAPRHHRFHRNARKARKADALDIKEPDTPNLPDSTDFVCGTLDEDRPLEQAYLNCIKSREAAKHKIRPQDIDPTFPTSDPDMDEEDDEDLEDPEEGEDDDRMVHGNMDDMDDRNDMNDQTPIRRRSSLATKRQGTARSPPPPPRPHSPAPKRRVHQSPPPQKKRGGDMADLPQKLFGKSPIRRRSPAPRRKATPPPRASPNDLPFINAVGPFCLAQRTHLTHTASLPRAPGIFLGRMHGPDEPEGDHTTGTEAPKRGAIDIVKGLERKRQRRKEKLYQKACAKAAATKNEKVFRVKPGRGAERMRELGLELQRYHGKGEFILSA